MRNTTSKFFDPLLYLSYFPYGQDWTIPDYQLDENSQASRFKVRILKQFVDWALESKQAPLSVLDLSTGSYFGN